AYWASLGGRFSFDCRRGCIGASDPASDRCNTIASSGITPQWSRAPQAQLRFPRHGVSRRLLTPSLNRVIETDFSNEPILRRIRLTRRSVQSCKEYWTSALMLRPL